MERKYWFIIMGLYSIYPLITLVYIKILFENSSILLKYMVHKIYFIFCVCKKFI